ncbi:MAG: JAB domain-containing protein [Candidatus Pacearchaeota archaeon]
MEKKTTTSLWHIPEIQVSYKRIRNNDYPRVIKSIDAYDLFIKLWDIKTIELYEEFKVLFVNQASKVFGIYTLSKGGINGTVVDIRLLFGIALKVAATGIIMAHNHPSGNDRPSKNDEQITDEVMSIGKLHNIKLIDHLIITSTAYYSFSDEGML